MITQKTIAQPLIELMKRKFDLIYSMNKRERNALGLELAVKIAINKFDLVDEMTGNILQLVRELKNEIEIDETGNAKFI